MTTINLVDRGFLSRDKLNATFGKARKEMLDRALRGTKAAAPSLTALVQSHVQGALHGNKAAKSIKAKVWNKQRDKFPALQISSKIPWLGVHQHGATINGRMLIQIGRTKGRRKTFLALVDRLMKAGQAFFKKAKDGKTYLWAAPPKGTRGLGAARGIERQARKALGGKGTIKRGEAFPIAILVTKVTIKKRLKVDQIIEASLPILVSAVQNG